MLSKINSDGFHILVFPAAKRRGAHISSLPPLQSTLRAWVHICVWKKPWEWRRHSKVAHH